MLEDAASYASVNKLTDKVVQTMKEKLISGIQLQFSARPVMVKLAEKLDEAICLAVPSGEQMLVVDMVSSSRPCEFSSFVGRRYPWALSSEEADFFEGGSAALCQPCATGMSQSTNLRIVRIPLWNGQQKVCGWLCLLGLMERLTSKRLRESFQVLREEGESLSVSLSKGWA